MRKKEPQAETEARNNWRSQSDGNFQSHGFCVDASHTLECQQATIQLGVWRTKGFHLSTNLFRPWVDSITRLLFMLKYRSELKISWFTFQCPIIYWAVCVVRILESFASIPPLMMVTWSLMAQGSGEDVQYIPNLHH